MIKKLFAFIFIAALISVFIDISQLEKESIQPSKEAVKADQVQSEAERKKQEENCEKDRQCRLEKYSFAAMSVCQDAVERLPKYEYEWIDGLMDQKFSDLRWSQFDTGVILVAGDKIKLQNGFGAYQNYKYGCEINVVTGQIVNVFAEPGRLN